MEDQVRVSGLKFLLIYVEDLDSSLAFYQEYLGFKKTAQFSPTEVYGELGDTEMWLGAGYRRGDADEGTTRTTAMIGVDSVGRLMQKLRRGGVPTIQDAPVEMQEGVYWLQFKDPAGNVLDVLGGE